MNGGGVAGAFVVGVAAIAALTYTLEIMKSMKIIPRVLRPNDKN